MIIDHIAIVATDLEQAKAFYEKLGFKAGEQTEVVEQYSQEKIPHRYRAVVMRSKTGRGPALWIMEPEGEEGPLNRFLELRGPGLHHIGLHTDDIHEEAQNLASQDITFIRPVNDFPEDGEIRALIHPREGQGVLIELVQREKSGSS